MIPEPASGAPIEVNTPLVLFDGICALCSSVVRFTRQRMKPNRLEFLPLQTEAARTLLEKFGQEPEQLNTFVLIEKDRCSVRSTAALRLVRHLRFPWPLLSVALLIPRPLRDVIYVFIARRRYKWFGTCELPTTDAAQTRAAQKKRRDA